MLTDLRPPFHVERAGNYILAKVPVGKPKPAKGKSPAKRTNGKGRARIGKAKG